MTNNIDNNNAINKLILDTHIIIWYVEGIKLSDTQVDLIDRIRTSGELYISNISIWEIAMLFNKGKIIFSITLSEWINKLLSTPGLNLMDLSTSILIESCGLPHYEHKDPVDRMLIATARNINSYLMTFDQKIIEYASRGYLKIVDNN
jgi:PIN domain nuclease of toxin-antitoxin system